MFTRTQNRLVVATCFFTATLPVQAGVIHFDAFFSAEQSLWAGGPSAGFDESARTSGSVGLYYDAKANSGTVEADVNGRVRTTFESVVSAGSPTELNFDFLGQTSSFGSAFGASIETGVFLDINGCVGAVILGSCVGIPYDIDQDIGVIDEGFFLEPETDFAADLGSKESANDATEVAGVGSVDLVIGELGPSIDLDLDQTIEFTPQSLNGLLAGRNLDTGAAFTQALGINTDFGTSLEVTLDPGTWEFSLLDFGLDNRFRNDIDLELRPNFDYIVGSWPPAGNELFGFGLIDETFTLDFSPISSLGSFTILAEGAPEPPSAVSGPGALSLMGLGMFLLGAGRRRASMR